MNTKKKQFNKNTKYKLANLQLCCKQPLNGLIQAVKSSPQHIVFGTRVSFVTCTTGQTKP